MVRSVIIEELKEWTKERGREREEAFRNGPQWFARHTVISTYNTLKPTDLKISESGNNLYEGQKLSNGSQDEKK